MRSTAGTLFVVKLAAALMAFVGILSIAAPVRADGDDLDLGRHGGSRRIAPIGSPPAGRLVQAPRHDVVIVLPGDHGRRPPRIPERWSKPDAVDTQTEDSSGGRSAWRSWIIGLLHVQL